MLQIVFTKLLLHKLIQQQRDIRNIYHADSHILPENIDVNKDLKIYSTAHR